VFAPSSKARLTNHDLGRFPDDTHFHRIARVVCAAGCLPRKELFEAWEVARRFAAVSAAAASSTCAPGMGCSARSCCCSTTRPPSMLLLGEATNPSNRFYEAFGAERLCSSAGEFHGGYGWRDLRLLVTKGKQTTLWVRAVVSADRRVARRDNERPDASCERRVQREAQQSREEELAAAASSHCQ
jgi:hypothetical protein